MKRCLLRSAVFLGMIILNPVCQNMVCTVAYAQNSEMEKTVPDMSEAKADLAVRSFIDAAKRADIEELMQFFAIKEYVENYQSDAPEAEYIERPVLEERELEAAASLMGFYTGLHMKTEDYENFEKFMEWVESTSPEELLVPEKYDALEILRIDLPESDAQLHEERIGNEFLQMRLYGAEGWDYRTALLSFGEETYYCGFGFVVYDGEYKIDLLRCPIVSLNGGLTVFPCTEEEYQSIIAE